ncbi:uncharacterized protein LOC122850948 [Aphidius gifuensis]|uniref:uncharacterized protein LOC122850948 n=1 Tax=Aphidius gifuensis TaxID=684658 RepID=UPI001CDBB8A6|nr:uncharacterized protein LOC122850948 [Aphidius gifuensis]
MNKYFLLLFFCINLPDLLLTSDSSEYDEYEDALTCQVPDDEPSKIIHVITSNGFTDKCSIFISSSTVANNFDIHIKIRKDMNTYTCSTGIEYVDPQNPEIISLKDGGLAVCSFKIYPNLIERRGLIYLGKYWKIVHEYYNYWKNDNYRSETNLFFMNTAEWWRQNKYTHLALRASGNWINEYSNTDYYSV